MICFSLAAMALMLCYAHAGTMLVGDLTSAQLLLIPIGASNVTIAKGVNIPADEYLGGTAGDASVYLLRGDAQRFSLITCAVHCNASVSEVRTVTVTLPDVPNGFVVVRSPQVVRDTLYVSVSDVEVRLPTPIHHISQHRPQSMVVNVYAVNVFTGSAVLLGALPQPYQSREMYATTAASSSAVYTMGYTVNSKNGGGNLYVTSTTAMGTTKVLPWAGPDSNDTEVAMYVSPVPVDATTLAMQLLLVRGQTQLMQ